MSRRRTLSRFALAAVPLALAAPAGADTVKPIAAIVAPAPDPRACAAFDLHHVMSIEDHGGAGEVEAEIVIAAFDALVRARALCRGGRVREALDAYAAVDLAPPRARRFR